MAYDNSNLDWTGCGSATPSSDPRADPRDASDKPNNPSPDWRGMPDAKPASSPDTKSDKQR